jgi:ribosomal protein S6
MVRYETLVLTVPEITAHESAALEEQFDGILKKSKGTLNSFERWGKYRLAYPVRGNDYGVYFLSRFEMEKDALDVLIKDIRNLFTVKYPQLVMRYVTTKLNPDQSLIYQKPESLEDIPAQDVDTFLRENKMEGLLKPSKTPSSFSRERREGVEVAKSVQDDVTEGSKDDATSHNMIDEE